MNNQLIQLKVKQRLNKLDSQDYDNIPTWMIVEAFNKAQREVAREKTKLGELDKQAIEDLNPILVKTPLEGNWNKTYFQSVPRPNDFMSYNKIVPVATREDCTNPRRLKTYLVEEGNIEFIVKDPFRKPSFKWGETVVTMMNSAFRIWSMDEFQVESADLYYYRFPKDISVSGSVDPSTGVTSSQEQQCEFKDDLVEVIIDRAVSIIAGDIESVNEYQISNTSVQRQQ